MPPSTPFVFEFATLESLEQLSSPASSKITTPTVRDLREAFFRDAERDDFPADHAGLASREHPAFHLEDPPIAWTA
jgi:hypothetical protein